MTEGDKNKATGCSAGNHLTPNPERCVSLPACLCFQSLQWRGNTTVYTLKPEPTFTLAPLPFPPKLVHLGGPAKEPESKRQRLQWAPHEVLFIQHPMVTNVIQSHFTGHLRKSSDINVPLLFHIPFVFPLSKTTTRALSVHTWEPQYKFGFGFWFFG